MGYLFENKKYSHTRNKTKTNDVFKYNQKIINNVELWVFYAYLFLIFASLNFSGLRFCFEISIKNQNKKSKNEKDKFYRKSWESTCTKMITPKSYLSIWNFCHYHFLDDSYFKRHTFRGQCHSFPLSHPCGLETGEPTPMKRGLKQVLQEIHICPKYRGSSQGGQGFSGRVWEA